MTTARITLARRVYHLAGRRYSPPLVRRGADCALSDNDLIIRAITRDYVADLISVYQLEACLEALLVDQVEPEWVDTGIPAS